MPPEDQAQAVVVTEPASVKFLKNIREQAGHLDWDFSRPNRVSAPGDGTLTAEAGVLKTLKLEKAGLAGELVIEGRAALDWLSLKGNRLTAVEFKNLPNLGGFEIVDGHLTSLTFGGGLGRLNWGAEVEAPNLARLVISSRNRLSELYIKASRLEDLSPLARLKRLAVLQVKSDSLSDLSPLAGCSFPDLSLESPLLGDLWPLRRLKYQRGLNALYLAGGLISDLRPLIYLRNTLHELDVVSPVLSDLSPLARLTKLYILGVFSDAVTDLSHLAGLHRLTDLVLEGRGMRDFTPLAKLEKNLHWEIINGRQLKGGESGEHVQDQIQ